MENERYGKSNFGFHWISEALILVKLYHGESVYGYSLVKTNMPYLSESAVYPILRRLNNKGYLDVHSQTHNHRVSKMYRITAKGKEYYSKLVIDWISAKESIDRLL